MLRPTWKLWGDGFGALAYASDLWKKSLSQQNEPKNTKQRPDSPGLPERCHQDLPRSQSLAHWDKLFLGVKKHVHVVVFLKKRKDLKGPKKKKHGQQASSSSSIMSPGRAWWLLRPQGINRNQVTESPGLQGWLAGISWESDSATSTASDLLAFARTDVVHWHGACQVGSP